MEVDEGLLVVGSPTIDNLFSSYSTHSYRSPYFFFVYFALMHFQSVELAHCMQCPVPLVKSLKVQVG